MNSHRKIMQEEWKDNTHRYTDPIGMTGRRPDQKEFSATVEDIRSKFDLSNCPHNRILDVGCNNGYLLSRLNPNAKHLIAIDFCLTPLRSGKAKFEAIDFIQGDISNLPFKKDSFDRVLCYNMFHYLPTQKHARDATTELFRVLAPRGILLIGDIFVEECKHLIPIDDIKRWDDPERPFMHRISNWLFVSLKDLQHHLLTLGAETVEIHGQKQDVRCSGYRFDLIVKK